MNYNNRNGDHGYQITSFYHWLESVGSPKVAIYCWIYWTWNGHHFHDYSCKYPRMISYVYCVPSGTEANTFNYAW